MFFILSKLLVFLIRPLTWILILLLLGIWARGKRWRRGSLIAALGFFLFFTNRFLSNVAVGWWEVETITAESLTVPYDIGILLGGYTSRTIRPSLDRQNFSERANRFLNALELFENDHFQYFMLSGGSGSVGGSDAVAEALGMETFLLELGLPDSVLIVEAASRNTRENALFSKRLIDAGHPGSSCLLMTSAWHMPRALACFEKAGLEVTPFSVDHLYEEPGKSLDWWLLPQWKALYVWELLIKEWMGYMAYKVNGYL